MYMRKFGEGRRAVVIPNAAWLEADLESLAKNHTVIFYDPRGRGRSEPFAATLETEIADLDSVIRHFELEQVVLLGWSYHGAVVAHYASRNPGKVLRVIQCGPLAPRRLPYQNQALATLQSRLDMPAITELMKSPPSNPVEICKAFNSILLRTYVADPGAPARSLATPCESENEWPAKLNVHMNVLITSFGDWDWRPMAAGCPGPVLIIHGEADWNPVEGSKEWESAFPDARLVLVPSAGHFPWLEQPELFFNSIEPFLGDVV